MNKKKTIRIKLLLISVPLLLFPWVANEIPNFKIQAIAIISGIIGAGLILTVIADILIPDKKS